MKKKYKNIIFSLATVIILTCLIVFDFIGILPAILARVSSQVYLAINYLSKEFKFDTSEYAYEFWDYYVRYKNEDGETIVLMMLPEKVPIIVR